MHVGILAISVWPSCETRSTAAYTFPFTPSSDVVLGVDLAHDISVLIVRRTPPHAERCSCADFGSINHTPLANFAFMHRRSLSHTHNRERASMASFLW